MSCQVLISSEIHEQISCWSPGMWSISRHQFWWIWSWSWSNFEQILITRHVLNLYHQKVGVRLLKLTSEFGCASDPVYLALFHYIDGKFRHSLNILEETKPKLYQDYIFYWNEYRNKQPYSREMLGKPMSVKMKAAMVFDITILLSTEFSELDIEICLIKESKLRRCLPNHFCISWPFCVIIT